MEEEIIYFYNVKDGKYYQSRYTHRWLNNLQHQCKKQKEAIDKAIEYINKSLIISSILDGKKTYCLNNYTFDYKELLDILNEVE